MGHHHHKNKSVEKVTTNPPENSTQENNDLLSMLSSFNINNLDFSKIDMNKVKSMMNNIKLPDSISSQGAGTNSNGDARINLINSLKEFMPTKRARAMDNITKLLQITQLLNNNRNTYNKGN
jgi:predicted component of type VI protein secretion system